jgi:hypothetical protein
VTLAPEAGGALEENEHLVGMDIRAAIGHTAASPEQIRDGDEWSVAYQNVHLSCRILPGPHWPCRYLAKSSIIILSAVAS